MIRYVVEFFGTFFFLSVIVATGQPFLIAASLLAVILLGAATSGAHFNPAVSLMFWMKGDLAWKDMLGYVGAQVAGGLVALYVFRAFLEPMRNTGILSGFTNFASTVGTTPSVTNRGTMLTVLNTASAAMNTATMVRPSAMQPPMGGFRYRV
jgi:glycerol uptake facilitator-like aquaporin